MGIGLEDFGAGAFKLDALPPFLEVEEPLALVREIIDALPGGGRGSVAAAAGRGHDRQDGLPSCRQGQ